MLLRCLWGNRPLHSKRSEWERYYSLFLRDEIYWAQMFWFFVCSGPFEPNQALGCLHESRSRSRQRAWPVSESVGSRVVQRFTKHALNFNNSMSHMSLPDARSPQALDRSKNRAGLQVWSGPIVSEGRHEFCADVRLGNGYFLGRLAVVLRSASASSLAWQGSNSDYVSSPGMLLSTFFHWKKLTSDCSWLMHSRTSWYWECACVCWACKFLTSMWNPEATDFKFQNFMPKQIYIIK